MVVQEINEINNKIRIAFFDSEVGLTDLRVHDMGAVDESGRRIHSSNPSRIIDFLKNYEYICGHNIVNHDLRFNNDIFSALNNCKFIDTLYLSALLFPEKPHHRLLKDDKIIPEELNNPVNDSIKAMELFYDEKNAFYSLKDELKYIYYSLLHDKREFMGFFSASGYDPDTSNENIVSLISDFFNGKICKNSDLNNLIRQYPVELAYCLSAIYNSDKVSVLPRWVYVNFPEYSNVLRKLRSVPCHKEDCIFCREYHNIHTFLKQKFNYDSYRTYNGENLQEKAVQAAVDNKSLLSVFPTGGGKSITFQIPALMAAESCSGLTVVISPLQSLMKDQVDHLEKLGIADAVTINGLLNPIERAEAINRIQDGVASILYISPEALRSRSIERLLLSRTVVRFVIDEAHCFSAWGQDFRVDYLYIGDFIKSLQQKAKTIIPVSCFTATAKQKVISDICEYFRIKLGICMELFTTGTARANLKYKVLIKEENEKYITLRNIIEQKNCPTIVYVSSTKTAFKIAARLTEDGFSAVPYHGKMDSEEKIMNQEDFINGAIQIVVATSAFGMGVDKKDVGLVVHYDISDSLENYIQESGRAGRDESINAECYVLFNEKDLDKHFLLLSQMKLSINEIQQVWKAIKSMSKGHANINCSPLELARNAGWDCDNSDIETKIKTAVQALESAGYIERGQNSPRVYADSIKCNSISEARKIIDSSAIFNEESGETAIRIISKLISSKSRSWDKNSIGEARIDYISDQLGLEKSIVIESITMMRQAGILSDNKDLVAVYNIKGGNQTGRNVLEKMSVLENFMLQCLCDGIIRFQYKIINEKAHKKGITTSNVSDIKKIIYFWIIAGYIKKPDGATAAESIIDTLMPIDIMSSKIQNRHSIAAFAEQYLSKLPAKTGSSSDVFQIKSFSILEILEEYNRGFTFNAALSEMEEALLFIQKIYAVKLDGGFLVTYNAMQIVRKEFDNKIKYKKEDYKQLDEYYKSKITQIHIVGEFANMMVRDYDSALAFVNDYFQLDYSLFITKYFKGKRESEIKRNITGHLYNNLFKGLSDKQTEILNDDSSKYIVVAAGPGSGKTKILVNKLASLILLEDTKQEQLLMLTFSRAAVTEFKKRLIQLIGNAAYYVEIKTFHSYCFDLLGKIGNLDGSKNIVRDAVELIKNDEVECSKITKTVLVIDEAQDMDRNEYDLVSALIEKNENLRVIAVGDDDQNIFGFRGSDSRYLTELLKYDTSRLYQMTDNYRSYSRIIDFANLFAETIKNRIKSSKLKAVYDNYSRLWLVKSDSPEQSVISVLKHTWNKESGGSVGILTDENEQAYLIAAILKNKGYCVRLIQSEDSFSLIMLREFVYLMEMIREQCKEPVIPDTLWQRIRNDFREKFASSSNLELCDKILDEFETVNNVRYVMDLEEYITESKYEDFIKSGNNEIIVSTIHKSKGKEYDNVYMVISSEENLDSMNEERKRAYYVGITRAKRNLYICHKGCMDRDDFKKIASNEYTDNRQYDMPKDIIVNASLRDIHLGFYKTLPDCRFENINNDFQTNVLKLFSGNELLVEIEKGRKNNIYFYAGQIKSGNPVAKSSAAFLKRLEKFFNKGYIISHAEVKYIIKWKDKESDEYIYVVLPEIRMTRQD